MIKIEGVSKTFGEGKELFAALKSIDLEVKEGECVILSGISGSGKSTLLSLIAALDRPSSGKIVVDGELISKLPDLHASAYRAKIIGVVFQHFNLLESLSVEENVIIPLINSGLDMPTIHLMAEQAMQRALIQHKSSQDVSSLSGGEKQRCAIARALVHDPKIILCDEPTANLDRENSLKFIEMIQRLHETGKTIIVATHDPLFDKLPFESRIIHMEDGAIGSSSE
ncbi:ABC transporter ATP-binding protein [Sulfurovum sp. zt1-1]|uniref:ABC transporter ATP-binding protein n=1 Tax=Sulfurovum zhangzhouensis TaxID=3019067 RepID=A0ABT7QXD0_9BACT|nr:ABC transporter ATP-binding protein [Sulfurovum zhangzhouensis]MDM5271447.1 ABC transporter ATP-binding protein [Sulfurovum zhangzhouensis]